MHHAARVTERRRKRRKSREKLRPCWHAPAGGGRGVSAAGTDRMIRRTTSYVIHTISYVHLRYRRFLAI
jgi:hypothetical protein